MNLIPTCCEGLLLFEPQCFGDPRGYFMEFWNLKRYQEYGVTEDFVQDNVAFSQRGVLRGLHFQNPSAQGKLVFVLQGEVHDVAVDLRRSSPTYRQSFGTRLSAENRRQIYLPPGFAHGYAVTSETALFTYKCTDYYQPQSQHSILWNDPDLRIDWPISQPLLAEKDARAPRLCELPEEVLFD